MAYRDKLERLFRKWHIVQYKQMREKRKRKETHVS
jgi:hypothetical protein